MTLILLLDEELAAAQPKLGRLRVDVYDAAGAKLDFGAITSALSFSYKQELDRVGSFTLELPADEDRSTYLAQGQELQFFREGEGLVFRGIVDRLEWEVRGEEHVLVVTGASVARQLAWENTLLGLAFSGATLAAAVGDNATANTLLAGTGWAPGTLDAPATTLLARFDGVSRWAALLKAAEIFGLHVREDVMSKRVDVAAFGTASGLVFQNVAAVSPALAENTSLFPVSEVTVLEESQDLVNWILPLGAGEGLNKLDLRYSNRASPYAISNATGPDGRTYYYLEDAASVAAYGRRKEVLSVKDAAPLANSAAGFQAAANALYDVAATWLQRHKDVRASYTVGVTGLQHVKDGAYLFRPGEKLRLNYRGVTRDKDGTRRAWKTIAADVWVMGFTRKCNADGSDDWSIEVSTVDRHEEDGTQKLAQAFSAMHALQVSLRNYTYHEVHILQRTSIDGSNTATLTVKWDGNIALLHQAKLTFKTTALRSNVKDAAAGGGQTSSSGGASTPTSSGGSSHSHSVSGQTANADGSHKHQVMHWVGTSSQNAGGASPNASDAWNGTGLETAFIGTVSGSDHKHGVGAVHNHTHGLASHVHAISQGEFQLRDSGGTLSSIYVRYQSGVDLYTYETSADHTHSISTTTSASESAHTHSVTIASHTHTVSDHVHAQVYGIYTASNPVNPAVHVTINGTDRSVALGGPWNTVNADVEVDVTAYLQSGATERPLQQSNTIVFSGAVLADVEAVLRSRVTASSLVPV